MANYSVNVVWAVIFAVVMILSAAAIVWAWTFDRRNKYLLVMGAGGGAYAVGLWVQLAEVLPGRVPDLMLGALCMCGGTLLGIEGLVRRRGRSIGKLFAVGAITVTVVAEIWFGVVDPHVIWRVRAEDYVFAAVLTFGLVRGRMLSSGRRRDQILFVALVGVTLLCLARTWVGVSAESVRAGAQFNSDVFDFGVYVVYAILLVPIAAAIVSQEVSAVIDVFRRERDTDSLTGVLNRGGFMADAQRMIDDARLAPVTLVLCDLDHFKRVNDQFGHQAGDEVLRAFGRMLRESARNLDLVGRMGGEEFAILLGTSDCASGFEFAERVRLRLSSETFTSIPPAHRVTASFGVATANGRATLDSLTREADHRLYLAKEAGRDQSRATG